MTLTAVPDFIPAGTLPEEFRRKLNLEAPFGYGLTGSEIDTLVNQARERFRLEPTPGQLADAVDSMARQLAAEKATKAEQTSKRARLDEKVKTFLDNKGVRFEPFVMEGGGQFAAVVSYFLHCAWGDLLNDVTSMLDSQERLVELRRRVGEMGSSCAMRQHGTIGEMESAEREVKVRTARVAVALETFTRTSARIHENATEAKIRELIEVDFELGTFSERVKPYLDAARRGIEAFFQAEDEAVKVAQSFIGLLFKHGQLCDVLGIERRNEIMMHESLNVRKLLAREFSEATSGRDTSSIPRK